MRRAVIAGASLVGLMTAVRLREVGYDVEVLDRDPLRAGRPVDDGVPPLPLSAASGARFGAWAGRSSMYPRPVDFGDAGEAILDLDAWWLAALSEAGASGVIVRSGHQVVGVATTEGQVSAVRTDQESVPADVLVVAAGADSVGITPALGVQLPIVPESAAWCRVPGGTSDPAARGVELRDVDGPTVHGAIAIRDVRRVAWYGVYRAFGAAGARRDELARRYLSRLADSDDASSSTLDRATVWQRHAHCTVDHRAVVGPLASVPTVVLALPHGPFGNSDAVAIVEAAVRAASGSAPNPGDAAWSPTRFPQGATGGRMRAVA